MPPFAARFSSVLMALTPIVHHSADWRMQISGADWCMQIIGACSPMPPQWQHVPIRPHASVVQHVILYCFWMAAKPYG
jgi:hypothetical protein